MKGKKRTKTTDKKPIPPNGWAFVQTLTNLAVLGDSSLSLFASAGLLLLAVLLTKTSQTGGGVQFQVDPYQKLGPIPKIDPPYIFDYSASNFGEIKKAFEKDGVVAVRGLLPPDVLKDESYKLLQPTKRKSKGKQFHTVHVGAAFHSIAEREDFPGKQVSEGGIEDPSSFFEVAFLSKVPMVASLLLETEMESNETVRVLRDIFLAKDEDEYVCGWHVDDTGFWPATASSPGVNAWIALDDMPLEKGGGFALAVGSHKAPWKDEAHWVTGSTKTLPKDGFRSAADLFENRTGSGTCNMKSAAPHLNRRMEETKRIYNVKRGDVIFHTRWLFHRTVPFHKVQDDKTQKLYRRYSVRYGPGSAVIPPGYGTELSVLWDGNNANRTANDICQLDGPWYPQVWPTTKTEELSQLEDLVKTKMPIASDRKNARLKEMRPHRAKAAMSRMS